MRIRVREDGGLDFITSDLTDEEIEARQEVWERAYRVKMVAKGVPWAVKEYGSVVTREELDDYRRSEEGR